MSFGLNFKRNIVTTSDGSKTIGLQGLNEHYHSVHGALQESLHVFIKNGLQFHLEIGLQSVNVLEIGFGTGLNFLTTMNHLMHQPVSLEYTGLEAFPLRAHILNDLSYDKQFAEEIISFCQNVMKCPNKVLVSSKLQVKAQQVTERVEKIHLPKEHFDLIYFDAFGPRVQPEMWNLDVFLKMFETLTIGGCLVTYCAKGEVKRTLKSAGFRVESLPGPPGKREMTRALKC